MIIRNNMGEVMAVLLVRGPPVRYSKEVEVHACSRAMEFAREARFQDLILEGDNVIVMQPLRSSRATYSKLGHIFGDIQCMARGFKLNLLAVLRKVLIMQHIL